MPKVNPINYQVFISESFLYSLLPFRRPSMKEQPRIRGSTSFPSYLSWNLQLSSLKLRHRFKGSPILFKNHKCKQTHFPTPTYSQKLTLLCSPFEEAAAAVLKECGAEANNLVGLRRTMFSNREIFRLVAGCAE